MCKKIFVEVNAKFDLGGRMLPQEIVWEDGRIFSIDKIVDIRQAASLKAGGQGIRFTCRIGNQEKFLYYEKPYWFVEGKQ